VENPQVKFLMVFTNFGEPKSLVSGVQRLELKIFFSVWATTPKASVSQSYAQQ